MISPEIIGTIADQTYPYDTYVRGNETSLTVAQWKEMTYLAAIECRWGLEPEEVVEVVQKVITGCDKFAITDMVDQVFEKVTPHESDEEREERLRRSGDYVLWKFDEYLEQV